MRLLTRQLLALVVLPMVIGNAPPGRPDVSPCLRLGESIEPIGEGPLKIAQALCLPPLAAGSSPAIPSPDGSLFFSWQDDEGLTIGDLRDGEPSKRFDASLVGVSSTNLRVPFAWFEDGRSVLAVTQEKSRRGGWAIGPLRAFLALRDGTKQELPPLTHSAGPLDELQWIGNRGLALAFFGTRGSYYRPEHADPHPTIALVDAKTGRIIQSALLAKIAPNSPQFVLSPFLLPSMAWRSDQNGRVEALFPLSMDHWIFWQQGAEPIKVPLDVDVWQKPFAITPDGKAVLIMQHLTAQGWIYEHRPSPPPAPSAGPIAQLREIRSGRLIWSIDGRAGTFSRDGLPVISPDGRYAVISMPQSEGRYSVAIITMKSGRILQRVPSPDPMGSTIGFSDDSRSFRITGNGRSVTYAIAR